MAWTALALSLCLFISNVASIPLLAAESSSNITLPDNVTNHGEPNLLCTPSTGYTVFSFILANYVMHAATTQTFPGESPFHQLLSFVTALLFPATGVSRGVNTIARGILVTVNRKHGDLQKAAAAGALCMVVRTENWRPVLGHAIHGITAHRCVHSSQAVRWRIYRPKWLHTHRLFPGWQFTDDVPRGHTFESLRRIHGALKSLPTGYAYACVPPNAVIASPISQPTIHIAASLNSAKIIVAIFQTIFSSYTLYNGREDLIKQFGYASFSLTVAPYTIMSVVNLLGSLLMPAYSSVFVVRSEVMDELEHRHGKQFDGTVGALVPLTLGAPIQLASSDDAIINDKSGSNPRDAVVLETKPYEVDPDISIPACAPFQCRPSASLPIWLKRIRKALPAVDILPAGYSLGVSMNFILCFLVVVGVPLGIIGGLSNFNEGNSTLAQRVWTMTWLACGCVYGLGFGFRMSFGSPIINVTGNPQVAMWIDLGMRVVAAVPAIGGMVVVSQMIMAYGDCILAGVFLESSSPERPSVLMGEGRKSLTEQPTWSRQTRACDAMAKLTCSDRVSSACGESSGGDHVAANNPGNASDEEGFPGPHDL
ncbi:hypothetical protein BDZ89DRAFT_1038492 [Hymenopellis radicata]|nr:hypothetical protein BDZ89DRAFT_1038492 [Hymenopellis radicata]